MNGKVVGRAKAVRALAARIVATGLVMPVGGLPVVARAGARPGLRLVATIRHDVRDDAPAADDAEMEKAWEAVATVRREQFVPPKYRRYAYAAGLSLPIGYDQTISEPYVVALMTATAHVPVGGNIRNIATGSGYQGAVLSRIAARVTSVEIVSGLAAWAAERLARLGYRNVTVRGGAGPCAVQRDHRRGGQQ